MIKTQVKITEVEEAISRPAIFDITRQVMEWTGLKPDMPLQYTGVFEEAKQPGSEIAKDPKVSPNTFAAGEKLYIKSIETPDDDMVFANSVHQAENVPMFFDRDLGVVITPVYRNVSLELDFEYRAKDETSAKAWRDDIIVRLGVGRNLKYFDITYHYMFPLEYLVILEEIFKMRQKIDPYPDATFEDWLTTNSLGKMTQISTLDGGSQAWVIPEKQIRLTGWFNFENGPPEGSNTDGGATWTTSFTVGVRYAKPVQAAMSYPFVFHNQLIDQKYRPYGLPYDVDKRQRYYSLSGEAMRHFEVPTIHDPYGRFQGYHIPEFETWLPTNIIGATMRVISGLCLIDDSEGGDPSFLMDLTDLGTDLILDDKIKTFLQKVAPKMVQLYNCVFQLSLYQGTKMMPMSALRCTPDLKIYSTAPLSLRKYYHVRLSLVTDWHLLTDEAIKDLQDEGDVLKDIIDAIKPGVTTPTFPGNVDGYVPPKDLEDVKDQLDGRNPPNRLMNTVEIFFIQAYSRGRDAIS